MVDEGVQGGLRFCLDHRFPSQGPPRPVKSMSSPHPIRQLILLGDQTEVSEECQSGSPVASAEITEEVPRERKEPTLRLKKTDDRDSGSHLVDRRDTNEGSRHLTSITAAEAPFCRVLDEPGASCYPKRTEYIGSLSDGDGWTGTEGRRRHRRGEVDTGVSDPSDPGLRRRKTF